MQNYKVKTMKRLATIKQTAAKKLVPKMLRVLGKETITLVRDTSIASSKAQIVTSLLSLTDDPEEAAEWAKMCSRLEFIIYNVYQPHMELLLEEYSLFDPLRGAQGEATTTRAGIWMTEEQLRETEIRFLNKLWHVLEKSNFRLIAQEELDVAQAGHYLINLPITVDHSRIDKELLARYFDKYPRLDRPAITDEFLIFRRGLGIDTATDFFLLQKVDSLIQRSFAHVLRAGKALLRSVLNKRGKRLAQIPSSEIVTSDGAGNGELDSPVSSPGTQQRRCVFPSAEDESGEGSGKGGSQSNQRQKHACMVERVRIENMTFSISNFFQMSTVQEPTFKNIVVIWRPAVSNKSKHSSHEPPRPRTSLDSPSASPLSIDGPSGQQPPTERSTLNGAASPAQRRGASAGGAPPGQGAKPPRLGPVPEGDVAHHGAVDGTPGLGLPPREARRIEIRQFHDIPYSDMEIVLPEKKSPGLNHLDTAKLLVSAVTGIVAMAAGLKLDEDGSHLWLLVLFLAGLAAYVAKVYLSFKAAKDLYHVQITNMMFSKQLNSGHTSLLHFASEMISQEVKEVLIAYFLLLRNGPCTAERLDELCERFLARQLGESTDFDVPDAIEKLTMLKLVTLGYEGLYTAVSIPEALGASSHTDSLREMETYVCNFMNCTRHS